MKLRMTLLLRLVMASGAIFVLQGVAAAADSSVAGEQDSTAAIDSTTTGTTTASGTGTDEAVAPVLPETVVETPDMAVPVTEEVPVAVVPEEVPAPIEATVQQTAPPVAAKPLAEQPPMAKVVPDAKRVVITYKTTVLPVQPTINRGGVAVAGDLAARMPSVPVADKVPVPAKPDGALGSLRMALAGSVVPQPVLPFSLVPVAGVVVIGLMAFFVIASRFVSNYGLWLRLGGYVNAARSDVPAGKAISTLLFATPQLMGYELMLPRQHSPFSLVSDTNRFLNQTQFPMLSERRICI